ncbi:hypothetical protein CR513_44770, partial [Mucuna pruriens]
MKELGKLKYFLGIGVAYSKQDVDYGGLVLDKISIFEHCMFWGGKKSSNMEKQAKCGCSD